MKTLSVRVTDDDHARFKAHAASIGARSLSDWVDETLRAAVDLRRVPPALRPDQYTYRRKVHRRTTRPGA